MNQQDFVYTEIFNRYGNIKRARGPFLYTAKGVRLTDLYQEGGKAILGWGGCSSFTMLKNVINRGLTGSFNTDYTYRIGKAVSSLLNSKRKVFIFDDKQKAIDTVKTLSKDSNGYYIPWLEQGTKWSNIDALVVEPTLAWAQKLYLVALKEDTFTPDTINQLPTVRINGAMAEAVSRSIYDLIASLQSREEKQWFIYDTVLTKYWTRKGPYLYPKVPQDKYNDFIKHCLDNTLVISPDYDVPSIVPFGADKGVFRALEKNPFNM